MFSIFITSLTKKTKMRINQFIARCGICSRREAEGLVLDRKISVNEKILDNLAYQVKDGDKIKFQNKIITLEQEKKVFLFNKPEGFLTSRIDPLNRDVIYDILPRDLQKLITIGRLDYNSSGLLILTNDRELKQYYENPKNKIPRVYKVRVFGKVTEKDVLVKLNGEIETDEMIYHNVKTKIVKSSVNSWLEMTLTEGKYREIRKIMEFFGFVVNRLIRIQYGIYKLPKNLELGNVIEIKNK